MRTSVSGYLVAAVVVICAGVAMAQQPQPAPGQKPGQSPRVVDPRSDPSAPGYDPRRDPSHGSYNRRTDTRHPLYDPRTDPTSPVWDPKYDPKSDRDHPVKDPKRDPGADTRGFGLDIGAADVTHRAGDWPWGELFYGKEYPATLKITNDCRGTETVSIFVNGLPYLSVPTSVTVPGKSSKDVPVTIKTPPPPMPMLTGLPDEPKMDPNAFTDIQGNVVVWHPWAGKCLPKRTQYSASGHIHYDPPKPPPSDPDAKLPEKIAGAGACQVWWNTGQRPLQVKSEDECTARMQTLAAEYRSRVLQGHVDRAPGAWQWLPLGGIVRASGRPSTSSMAM